MKNLNTLYLDNENEYKSRLTVALKAAKICIFEVDLTCQLYTFFENAEDIFGISGEEILARVQSYSTLSPEEYQKAATAYFSHPDDSEIIAKAFESVLSGRQMTYEARMKAGDSAFVWCKLDVVPIMDQGQPVRMIGVITDISDMRRQKEMLEQKANIDGFTGLWSKNYAISAISSVLREASSQRHAMLLLDVDDFKYFNDTYGHAEGDRILLAIADRLLRTFCENSIVGRFGGDEFIIFVRNIQQDQRMGELQKKLESLTKIGCTGYSVTTSIGTAFSPEDGTDFEHLFERADQALYEAKRSGKGRFCINEAALVQEKGKKAKE